MATAAELENAIRAYAKTYGRGAPSASAMNHRAAMAAALDAAEATAILAIAKEYKLDAIAEFARART